MVAVFLNEREENIPVAMSLIVLGIVTDDISMNLGFTPMIRKSLLLIHRHTTANQN